MSGRLAEEFTSPITSLQDGEPYVGIPNIQGSSVPLILIPRNPGVQPPNFNFKRVGEPQDRTYEIRIDDRATLIEERSVVAVRDGDAQTWGIHFIESENAFIIQRGIFRPATVWTVGDYQIGVQINPGTTFPRRQLFRFSGLTDE